MISRITILFLICSFIVACGGSPKPHEKLNGTWQCPVMTVTIDFNKGTYKGVSLGTQFKNKLTLVSEQGNAIVFKSNESQITAQFQGDDSVILTKKGGVPIQMSRVK